MIGVVVGEHRTRLIDLGLARHVRHLVGIVLTALRTAIAPGQSEAKRRAARELLGRAGAMLDRLLTPVLRGDAPLVLVVPADLHALPWLLLPGWRGGRRRRAECHVKPTRKLSRRRNRPA